MGGVPGQHPGVLLGAGINYSLDHLNHLQQLVRKGSIQLATAKVTLMRYTIHQDESQNASQGGYLIGRNESSPLAA